MSQLAGKWKHVKSENLDDFLKAMNVGLVKRKMATSTSPSLEISIGEDGTWTITLNIGITSKKSTFKIGESFEDTGPAGNTAKVVASLEDDKLIMKPIEGENGPVVVREIVGEELVMTLTKGDVIAKRFFKSA
ncbi:fatty acid-binding protein homolog 6-like [Glandiceps talaboti]